MGEQGQRGDGHRSADQHKLRTQRRGLPAEVGCHLPQLPAVEGAERHEPEPDSQDQQPERAEAESAEKRAIHPPHPLLRDTFLPSGQSPCLAAFRPAGRGKKPHRRRKTYFSLP